MQLGGKSEEIKLKVDLTKYDTRCIAGSTGKTIPNYKCSMWGSMDHFVAVRFDNGAILDIAYSSLEFNVEV